jgi:hypothetical protein
MSSEALSEWIKPRMKPFGELCGDLFLPCFERDRPSVFHPWAVLREQARPMFGIAVHGGAAGQS